MNLLFHLAVNLIEYYHDYAGIDPLGEDSIIGGSLRLPMCLQTLFGHFSWKMDGRCPYVH